MNFTGFSKRTFPLIALFAASALSVTAEELTVTTAEELREKLTTKGTLDGNTVKLGVSPFILESEPPASEVIVDDPIPRTIVVLANVTVAGTSPADTVLQTTKNGDAFALAAVTLNFHSMAIAGSGTSSADADGRAIYLVGGGLVLSGGIEFKDRYFSAVPMTAFGASGGAIHSSNKLDKIDANTTAGAIVFSGITTFGNTFSKTDESTGTTSKTVTPVLGGAVHLAGAMRVSGANGAVFNKNRAVSLESDAFGGAVYITNVAYAIDGTQSGIYDPNDPVTAGLYGFAIAESSVSFSQNVASGARVIGGAVAVSGGAMMSAGNSSIQFSENSAKGTGTSVFGGALAVVGSGVVSFGKGTLLAFSKNTVESSGEFASAGGGGFYLEGSSAEIASGAEFSGNSVLASGAASSAFGGAIAVRASATGTGTKTTDPVVVISGDTTEPVAFIKNSVLASGVAKKKDDASETTIPQAFGGAIALSAGTLEISNGGAVTFDTNTAKTVADDANAFGGAICIAGEKTKTQIKSQGVLTFSNNSADQRGVGGSSVGGAIYMKDGSGTFTFGSNASFISNTASVQNGGAASGGAIALSAGTLKIDASKATMFDGNKAEATTVSAKTGEIAVGTARGGAIAQLGGTFNADTKATGTWMFSNNAATAISTTVTGTLSEAFGGAIYISGGSQNYVSAGAIAAEFSKNSAIAQSMDVGSIAQGGAIAVKKSGVELSFSGKTVFSQNVAKASAINDSGEAGARTAAQGGAIYSAGKLAFGSVNFSENHAEADSVFGYAQGGALYLASGTFSAGDLTFSGNYVSTQFDGRGGAIYQSTGEADFSSLILENNFADAGNARGGAVYSAGTLRVQIAAGKSFSAIGNRAGSGTAKLASGGAVYKSGGMLTASGAGTIEFRGNTATAGASGGVASGGFYYAENSATKIVGTAANPIAISGNSAVANNSGNAFGGAVYLMGGTHEFSHATFTGNTANGAAFSAGGAIYIDASSARETTLVLGGNTEISGNFASGGKSGIDVGNGISAADSLGDVKILITAAAKVTLETGADGTQTETLSDIETVKLIDPMTVDLIGTTAKFAFVKDASAGNLEWHGTNTVNVGSGEFSISLGKGVTTFKNDFSIVSASPTFAVKTFDLSSGAKLVAETGSVFPKFLAMTIASDASVDVAGTMVLESSSVKISGTGAFALHDGASVEIGGGNTISGSLFTDGNVTFSAAQDVAGETVSLSAGTLVVGSSGNSSGSSLDINYTGIDGTFDMTADAIQFVDSATITLGANTKLLTKSISAADPGNSISASIQGTGTIVLLGATTADGNIVFNSYYDSTLKKYVPSGFSIASGVKIENGVSISEGTTLGLGAGTGHEYKRVLIDGGTLLAADSSSSAPLKLYDLQISTKGAVLGKAGAGHVFEMAIDPAATEEDSSGNTVPATKPNNVSVRSKLEITDTTTLSGNVNLTSTASAELAGAGTLKGNVSGYGKISLAKIDGNVDVTAARRLSFSAKTVVSGDIVNAGTLTFSAGADVAANSLTNNGSFVVAGDSAFSGDIQNLGLFTVDGVLTLRAGSKFTQTAAGSLNLSSTGTIDFSALAASEISLAGTLVVDPNRFKVGDEFNPLIGLTDGELAGVNIVDPTNRNLTDRVRWDAALGNYVFLGLNGTILRTTLFGDLTRENLSRTYDFMRAGLLHTRTGTIRPTIFGEKKATSKYMRGYLERQARERGEPIDLTISEENPGDLARTLDRIMNNAWVQTQYSKTKMSENGENPRYEAEGYGALLGGSLVTSSVTEAGAVFGFANDKMKTLSGDAHKIDTESYELMMYLRRIGENIDVTLGVTGIYSEHSSERGLLDADFNSWQLGWLMEVGRTFRPLQTFEVRPYAGLQMAYSRTDSFKESGDNHAFDVSSDRATSFRSTLGMDFAFLPTDSLQVTFRGAWLLDFGKSTYGSSAYDETYDVEYSLRSRERENSAFEFGAYLNWRMTSNMSLFGGYTGTVRSGNSESRINLGVQFSF